MPPIVYPGIPKLVLLQIAFASPALQPLIQMTSCVKVCAQALDTATASEDLAIHPGLFDPQRLVRVLHMLPVCTKSGLDLMGACLVPLTKSTAEYAC